MAGVGDGGFGKAGLIQELKAQEVVAVVAKAEDGGAEYGFEAGMKLEIAGACLSGDVGVVLAEKGLEGVVAEDDTAAVVAVTLPEGGAVLGKQAVVEVHGAEHGEEPEMELLQVFCRLAVCRGHGRKIEPCLTVAAQLLDEHLVASAYQPADVFGRERVLAHLLTHHGGHGLAFFLRQRGGDEGGKMPEGLGV